MKGNDSSQSAKVKCTIFGSVVRGLIKFIVTDALFFKKTYNFL